MKPPWLHRGVCADNQQGLSSGCLPAFPNTHIPRRGAQAAEPSSDPHHIPWNAAESTSIAGCSATRIFSVHANISKIALELLVSNSKWPHLGCVFILDCPGDTYIPLPNLSECSDRGRGLRGDAAAAVGQFRGLSCCGETVPSQGSCRREK